MKLFPLLSVLAILLVPPCLSGQGVIQFKNVPPQNVLSTYEQLSGLELIISSNVRDVHSGINLETNLNSRSDAIAAVEKALQHQAGIVITKLDGGRASVTYNDALPIGSGLEFSTNSGLSQQVYRIGKDALLTKMRLETKASQDQPNYEVVRTFLEINNIFLHPPETFFYSATRNELIVRAKRETLDEIDALLSKLKESK